MSLEKYRRPRMVGYAPDTPVYDAARAMESNHIGIVVVEDRGAVVGVLTDRDIALRVIACELDPAETPIADVMTADPAILPITASEQEALVLMRDRCVRRIPLVENDRVVGLVTIDDLILSEGADPHAIADVIHAQLAEPADLKPAGEVHPVERVRPRPAERAGR